MLDFRIDTFLSVCRNMSYTKAANELGLTQPAVSQHIHFLENYYGSKLFSYDNKQLKLTDAGALVREAMLSANHDSVRLIEHIKNGSSDIKHLNFGSTLSIGESFLPENIIGFLKKNEDYCINFFLADTKELIEKLWNSEIDFAFIEGYFDKSDYEHLLVKEDELICVCKTDYDIPSECSLTDLFTLHTFIREEGSGTREVLAHALTEHGYSINEFTRQSTVNSLHTIVKFLTAGLGISFMYSSVAAPYIENGLLKEIKIDNFHASHEYNFIWLKNSLFSNAYKNIFFEIMD